MAEPSPFERAFFRETEDGTTVFFPWGLPYRGYELRGDGARRRASRAASALIGAAIAIGTWIAYLLQSLLESETAGGADVLQSLAAPGAALVFALLAYWWWVARFVEGLQESALVIPREERLREAAELTEPWKVALIGVVLCGASALLMWLQPRSWWMALLGIALGIPMLLFGLALRRAAGLERRPEDRPLR